MEQNSQVSPSDVEPYTPVSLVRVGTGILTRADPPMWQAYYYDSIGFYDFVYVISQDEMGAYARAVSRLADVKKSMERLTDGKG